MTTIDNMTLEQLQRLIDLSIDERLMGVLRKFEINDDESLADEETDARTWEEVKQDIEHHQWTPPHGAKSSLELLHEDRAS